ncbi:MAG: phenylalanine--tRNA ligase subunit beta [Terriglobia bacterium]|jgi:phenylalanyl-tRNA synthetase beta chain
MKISVNWLREFVDIASDPRQLKSDLTMIGLNTESLAQAGNDWVLDVEVTTNRPDCLSHYGVARELATHYRQSLKKLEFSVKESGGPAQGVVAIEISDPDLCARYCGRVVQNVQVKPSPDWLVKRLEAVGQRPINNVADATNYVLMELGHPLHAFDLSRLKQQKIIVRRAKPGEPLRTLDGVERTLTRDNLVIADGTHPVALAGVMGGEESEISPSTHAVLLESAWFEPVSVRRTSKSQGMHTEASHRFERGADIQMAPLALDRTTTLIQEIAGGEILEGMIDVYPRPIHRQDIMLGRSEITRILGAEIPGEEVKRILCSLGFQVERADGESWRISVPSFRVDVSREVDLVEEVARHVGYDRLPARVRPAPPRVERDTTRDKVVTVSSLLVGSGFHEIIVPSMVDPAESKLFSASRAVEIQNPLSQDASAMRTSAVPSMLRAIRWNLDRDTNDVRLFELGKTYNLCVKGVPEEHPTLTLGATGHRRAVSVYDSEARLDFFDLKGELEAIFGAFDVPGLAFEPSARPYLQQGRSGLLRSQGVELAVLGLIQQDLAGDYKLRQEVWVAEIDFERLLDFPLRSRKFQPISKFPAVERDFALVLPDELPYARLSSAIASLALEEMYDFRPIDRADRSKVPTLAAGHYALLLRVTFQSQNHTLTSEEVGALSQRLLRVLEELGAHLRG